MKRAVIFSFSDGGAKTAERIAAALAETYDAQCCAPRGDLARVVRDSFTAAEALVFVGACGIAVRAVAPLVAAKTKDPAVVVADERGEFVISLLSGHIGGANDLARRIAAAIGAQPVITTATDVNGRFSVDAWAARKGLAIESMALARRFSAEILKRDLPVYLDGIVTGPLPSGIYPGNGGPFGASVSWRDIAPFGETLRLVPRVLHLGVGCRRNTPEEKIAEAVDALCKDHGLHPGAIASLSSIDVKRDEAGLLAYGKRRGLPVRFYRAEELLSVEGTFSASAFVQSTVGVDNVCERAAMLSAGAGAELLIQKTCRDGVTAAIAREDWRITFE